MSCPCDCEQGRRCKTFQLEFECHGVEFRWSGCGDTQRCAEAKARAQLSHMNPSFNEQGARLVRAIQRWDQA